MTALRLGTRRSELARTQSGHVADALRKLGHTVEIVEIVTEGDVNSAPLTQLGGTGVFAAAIRQALLQEKVDLAVHSLKDLPVAPYPGLTVAAIPLREDPRDALVARDGLTLGELPVGSIVGTGSPRRVAALNALGLGLEMRAIRGNVDTRLAKVSSGELDAVILACAGLRRVNRHDHITEALDPLQMLPAPGQGALAVEIRTSDELTLAAVAPLDHADTRAAVTAERAVLAGLQAGCSAPIGALAEVVEDVDGSLEISLRAFIGMTDGSHDIRRSITGPLDDAEDLGRRLAQILREDGAADIMSATHPGSERPSGAGSPGGPHAQPEPVINAMEREQ
ncbi:hydroxymethylbilane synthase [Calidifontibacter terrae]